jgi:hypothetical protein
VAPDLDPEPGHGSDAAGWALDALNPADARAFGEHLPGCAECQQTVAEFQHVARVLKRPSPDVELPPDLAERTISAVLQAAAAARQPLGSASDARGPQARKMVRWPLRDWPARSVIAGLAAAAAVIVAAVVVPLSLSRAGASAPVAAEFSLQSVTDAGTAGGHATVYREPSGFKIVLSLHGLPATSNGQYYGCWYVGAQNRPGQPSLITAGSFTVGGSGTADPTMWSAANPATFPTMEITIDSATGPAPGRQILVGHAAV